MLTAPNLTSARSRMRERGGFVSASTVYLHAAGPSQTFDQVGGYSPADGEYEAMTDVVQPNFSKRVGNGEIIFNPMSSSRIAFKSNSSAPGALYVKPGWAYGQKYWYTGNFLPYALAPTAVSSTSMPALPAAYWPTVIAGVDRARCISEATTKAQRGPSDASLLVSLAESRQTLNLVPGLLKDWRRFFHQINSVGTKRNQPLSLPQAYRASLRHASELERTLVNTWLAMRFGVRPLVAETLGVMKALKEYSTDGRDVRLTTRGSAQSVLTNVRSYYVDTGAWRTSIMQSDQNSCQVRAMSLWELKMDVARDLGFSLSAIPEAAVDLLKFSFVLNWVVNINDYFAALGALADRGLSSRGGCYTITDEKVTTWQALGTTLTDPNFVPDGECFGVATSTHVAKQRVVGLPSPVIGLRSSPLSFLSDWRLLDAVTLLRQQTRGRNVRLLGALSGVNSKMRLLPPF